MTTNPTDPAAVEAWLTAMDEGRLVPCLAEHCPACEKAARVVQSYGDQREADARADERARCLSIMRDVIRSFQDCDGYELAGQMRIRLDAIDRSAYPASSHPSTN